MPRSRTSLSESFGVVVFLVAIFPAVIFGFLLGTGTSLNSASALVEVYYILLFVAFLVYIVGWFDRRFKL